MAEKEKNTDDEQLELPQDSPSPDPNPEDILPGVDAEPESDSEDDGEEDPITDAFFDLLSDDGLDFLWELVGDMVDGDEVEDIPAEDATQQEKQAWLDKNMSKIKKRFKEELDGDTDLA